MLGAGEQVRRWWGALRRLPAVVRWSLLVVVGLLCAAGAYVIPRDPVSGLALVVIAVLIPTLAVMLALAREDGRKLAVSSATFRDLLNSERDAWAKQEGKLAVWRELDQDIEDLHGLGHYLVRLGHLLYTAEEAIDFWYEGLTGKSRVRELLDLWIRLGRPRTFDDLPPAAKAHPDATLLEELEGIDVHQDDELVYGTVTQARLGDEQVRLPLPVAAGDFDWLPPERVAVIVNQEQRRARVYTADRGLIEQLQARWPDAEHPDE
jgi:hypothetical protein